MTVRETINPIFPSFCRLLYTKYNYLYNLQYSNDKKEMINSPFAIFYKLLNIFPTLPVLLSVRWFCFNNILSVVLQILLFKSQIKTKMITFNF